MNANRRNLDQLVRLWGDLGLQPTALPALGPYPNEDIQGVSVAVAMLLKSTKPGRHNEEYTQFEMMRKLQATFSNLFHASAHSSVNTLTMGRDTTKLILTTCPDVSSAWDKK